LAIDWTNRKRPPEGEDRAPARYQEQRRQLGNHHRDHIRLSWVADCADSDARRGSILFWLLQKIGRSDAVAWRDKKIQKWCGDLGAGRCQPPSKYCFFSGGADTGKY